MSTDVHPTRRGSKPGSGVSGNVLALPTILWCLVLGVIALIAPVGIAQQPLPPLSIAGNMTTIELAPVLLAANGLYRGQVTVIDGGIPNLMRKEVDAATNAETQLLRQSVDDPSLRIIFTEAEG